MGQLAVGSVGQREDRVPESADLDRGLGCPPDLAGEGHAHHGARLGQGPGQVAREIERVHRVGHDRGVPMKRQGRGLPGEGAVAAPGEPEVLDAAVDEDAREAAQMPLGVLEGVGDDVGDHRDLVSHDVDVVVVVGRRILRLAAPGGGRSGRSRRKRHPGGARGAVSGYRVEVVRRVVEQPQAAGVRDREASSRHPEGDGVDRCHPAGKAGRHATAE